MVIRTIKYTDFDGNPREETCCFHMNKAEVIKWLTTDGDYTLDKKIKRLASERNGQRIMEIFEDLMHRSYGRKSLDGRRFEKTKDLWDDFHETEAFSIIFCELVSDAKKAAAFVNGIIPEEMAKEIEAAYQANKAAIPPEYKDYLSLVEGNEPADAADQIVSEAT